MAQTLKIKRSTSTASPTSLENGELAYSSNSNKLFIGRPGGTTGDIDAIGGKFFTDMLDHTAGTLTASSAIITDANSKVDVFNVDNIRIDGNAIVSTNVGGDIEITPDSTGNIVLDGQNWPQADGSADSFLKTNGSGQLSWASIPSGSFTISDGTTTDTFTTGQTLTFAAGSGISTTVSDNQVTIAATGTTYTDADARAAISVTDAGGDGSLAYNSSTGVITYTGPSAAEVRAHFTAGAAITLASGEISISDSAITNAKLQNSSVTFGTTEVALGASSTSIAGVTELTVDNININGNEISSTDANGDISLNPNGIGTVDVNSARIANVGTPSASTDAATKAYVDGVAQGLHVHAQAHAIATSSLATITGDTVTYDNGTSGVGATLTLSTALDLAGGDIDGDTDITTGDRIIINGESNAAHNGVYVITSTTVLTRASDFDTPTEMAGGDFIFVTHGTTYADTGWVLGEAVTTVGTDNVNFVQFSGAGAYTAGSGLTLTGTEFSVKVATAGGIEISAGDLQLKSTVAGAGLTYSSGVVAVGGTSNRISVSADAIDISASYVGQSSITTLGTIATGTWNADTVTEAYGGTNQTTYTQGDILYASAANTLSKLALGTAGQVLVSDGTDVTWGSIDGGTF
jgi:hypothetical protein